MKLTHSIGATLVTVHGRTRAQVKHEGPVSWDAIKAVKASLTIPVIGNGGVKTLAEAEALLEYTKCDAIMVATGHFYF